MRNNIIFGIVFLFISNFVFGQTEENPVVWKTAFKTISETEYDIIFEAKILKDWHLYSQYNPDEASLPLEISSNDPDNLQIVGKATESKTYTGYSDVWEKDEIFFKESARLVQRIKLTNTNITTVKMNLFGQVCKEVCININEDFNISLDGKATHTNPRSIDE